APSKNAVRDQFESVGVPVGAIFPWPTESVPTGYLECDGSSQLIASYPQLYNVIGTSYGRIAATHFYLPDYRGWFMRGWDHGASVDDDAASRTASDTASATMTAGDHVGTEQGDTYEQHTHSVILTGPGNNLTSGSDTNRVSPGTFTSANGTDVSGETRPKNIYVMYIIKY
ncbi:MAG: phage tail protein, partial [Clostridia bacterium]